MGNHSRHGRLDAGDQRLRSGSRSGRRLLRGSGRARCRARGDHGPQGQPQGQARPIYGQVNEAVMFWDDGFEQNAYVVTNDASRSRFGFKGGAKINDDWSANFKIEIGVRTANSKRTNQDDPQAIATIRLRRSPRLVEPEEQDLRHLPGRPHADRTRRDHRSQSRRHQLRRQVLGRGRQRPRHVPAQHRQAA